MSAFELELRKYRGSKQTVSLLKMHSAKSAAFQTSVILGCMLQGKVWDVDCCSVFLLLALHKWLYFTSNFLVIFFPITGICYSPGLERAAAFCMQTTRNRVRRRPAGEQEGFLPPFRQRSCTDTPVNWRRSTFSWHEVEPNKGVSKRDGRLLGSLQGWWWPPHLSSCPVDGK